MKRADNFLKKMSIVVIDDEKPNVEQMERIFQWAGFDQVTSFTDPIAAMNAVSQDPPDAIILDLQMPKFDGFQLLRRLRAEDLGLQNIPILVFTADLSPETRLKALEMGASDFLTKPGEPTEVLLRVLNMLEIRYLQQKLQAKNEELESLVDERTQQLELSRVDALERLALAAEFRHDETGEHAKRVGLFAAEIAAFLGSPDADPRILRLAAPLHDIGKVAIPDAILLKPGLLTPEEFQIMKSHTTLGARILSGTDSPVFCAAAEVALSHHEKWDGSGYPNGLAGHDIPLVGRIVAVADVFDALTHKRAYKEAWLKGIAVDYICGRAGRDFDPDVVRAFELLCRTNRFRDAA